MKKLYFIKNPEVFQGEKYLEKNKLYFEGWYFKNSSFNNSIAFIPGINIDEKGKNAFIQVITKEASYFVNYNIADFRFSHNPFFIQIGNNYFSKEKITVDIKEENENLKIIGTINYYNSTNITTNILAPNIMGPFSYIPKMQCNHAILCMKNKTSGLIHFNNKEMDFNSGIGYIEKDWGYSFPKEYIWCQGNNFEKSNASFMMSIANIPFGFFDFQGIICVLIINGKEYKFTTYNNSKIIKYNVSYNEIDIIIRKGAYCLNLKSEYSSENKLRAPLYGKMIRDIFESISSVIYVTLSKKNKIIFEDTSNNCGLEIVKELSQYH